MLNKFPLWKNSLILIAALFAFVYASPNYFPADAAIQLSGQSGSMIIDEDVLKKMEQTLDTSLISFFGGETYGQKAIVRI